MFPNGFGATMRRRLYEALALMPGFAGCALFVALVSYNPTDPSPNVASDAAVGNLLGGPGAFTADLLLSTLGLAAFALAALLVAWSWRLLRGGGRKPRWWLRLAAAPLALLLLATGLAAVQAPETWPLRSGLGGFAGVLALEPLAAVLPGPGIGGLLSATLGVVLGFYAAALRRADWAAFGRVLSWASGGAGRGLADAVTRGKAVAERARDGMQRSEEPAPARNRPARREPELATPATARSAPVKAAAPVVADAQPEAAAPAAATPAREPDTPGRSLEVEPRAPSPQQSKKAGASAGKPAPQGPDESGYEPPPLSILSQPPVGGTTAMSREVLEENARTLETVLQDFGVKGEIVKIRPGPVVTRYELEPAPGTKTSRVVGLADDIARSMAAVSVRVAVVPGSSVIGIELPNRKREAVYLRELLASDAFDIDGGSLPLALGKDISGNPTMVDLARMPHLLVAGTTGSGKSVAVNAMLLSLLYRLPPERCRMILIDPKMLELSVYEGIPHLLSEVVTDPKKAVVALKWTVREMEERYRAMSRLGVRNIDGYNARVEEARQSGEVLTRKVQTGFDPDTGSPIFEEQPFDLKHLPYIVVVVDEMADLMLVAGKEIEMAVQRLAQMARAAGIHIIMATQRPSVDVITGTIKANFPTRISFHVTSKIDSRTILGETGAEQLLGMGDMLYMAHGGRIARVHGPLVTDGEVEEAVAHLRTQGAPDYIEGITAEEDDGGNMADLLAGGGDGGEGDLYQKAVAIVCQHKKASTSFVQRQLQIGYNRAARLIERMESEGVVSAANHVGKREILIEHPGERE